MYRTLAVMSKPSKWQQLKCASGEHVLFETSRCFECQGSYFACKHCKARFFQKRPGCLLYIVGGCTQSHT
jgi:hypothetical protein